MTSLVLLTMLVVPLPGQVFFQPLTPHEEPLEPFPIEFVSQQTPLLPPPTEDLAPQPEMTRQQPSPAVAPPAAENVAAGPPATFGREYQFGPLLQSTTWLYGNASRFGMFSIEATRPVTLGSIKHLTTSYGFHFLTGPKSTDMPPRLFDFYLGYHDKHWLGDRWGYELSVNVGVSSDFEGSAREGVRFPSHAVLHHRSNDRRHWLLGAQHLDWDGLHWLPVAGLLLTPTDYIQLEVVFPRPRVAVRLRENEWFYIKGELDGGSWAIERDSRLNDVATYSAWQVQIGWQNFSQDKEFRFFEIAYVYNRRFEYRSTIGDFEPADTILLRSGVQY